MASKLLWPPAVSEGFHVRVGIGLHNGLKGCKGVLPGATVPYANDCGEGLFRGEVIREDGYIDYILILQASNSPITPKKTYDTT